MMKKRQVIKIIRQYIEKLKKSGISPEAVYLFGSFAKNKAGRDSDIDLCIVSNSFGKNRQEERVFLLKLTRGISDDIEPHPFSQEDFNNKYNSLAWEIKKYHIRII